MSQAPQDLIKEYFPLHQKVNVKDVRLALGQCLQAMNQPINDQNDYVGEGDKFLTFYTKDIVKGNGSWMALSCYEEMPHYYFVQFQFGNSPLEAGKLSISPLDSEHIIECVWSTLNPNYVENLRYLHESDWQQSQSSPKASFETRAESQQIYDVFADFALHEDLQLVIEE